MRWLGGGAGYIGKRQAHRVVSIGKGLRLADGEVDTLSRKSLVGGTQSRLYDGFM